MCKPFTGRHEPFEDVLFLLSSTVPFKIDNVPPSFARCGSDSAMPLFEWFIYLVL